MIEPELVDAYIKTTYVVYDGTKTINIRIDKYNPDIDTLMEKYGAKSWLFFTAFNPYSKKLSETENKFRQHQLLTELIKADYLTFPGAGIPDNTNWLPEESVLILFPDLIHYLSLSLITKYQQNGVVTGKAGQRAELRIFA